MASPLRSVRSSSNALRLAQRPLRRTHHVLTQSVHRAHSLVAVDDDPPSAVAHHDDRRLLAHLIATKAAASRAERCWSAAPHNADPAGAAPGPSLAPTLRTQRRPADGVSRLTLSMSAHSPAIPRRCARTASRAHGSAHLKDSSIIAKTSTPTASRTAHPPRFHAQRHPLGALVRWRSC